MDLEVKVWHGLAERVKFVQTDADVASVLRTLSGFLGGRDVKSVVVRIEEKTRHD